MPGAVEGPDTPDICVPVGVRTRGTDEYPQLFPRSLAAAPASSNHVERSMPEMILTPNQNPMSLNDHVCH